MFIHYNLHFKKYADTANAAIAGKFLNTLGIEELLTKYSHLGTVKNNAGGFYNHCLFWFMMTPNKTYPSGDSGALFNKTWAKMDDFANDWAAAGTGLFGSGWVWL